MTAVLTCNKEFWSDFSFEITRGPIPDSKKGVFRRYHVGNNPVNWIDPLGLSSQWHFDFTKEGERLIHYGKYRFNQLGQLVEHGGKVIGKACGKAAKALKYLKNVKPGFFIRVPIIIINPCVIDPAMCQDQVA